jgi:hypothetical protein
MITGKLHAELQSHDLMQPTLGLYLVARVAAACSRISFVRADGFTLYAFPKLQNIIKPMSCVLALNFWDSSAFVHRSAAS